MISFKNFLTFIIFVVITRYIVIPEARRNEKKIILFNSHLVTDPDFIAHFLNICALLLRL